MITKRSRAGRSTIRSATTVAITSADCAFASRVFFVSASANADDEVAGICRMEGLAGAGHCGNIAQASEQNKNT